MAPSSGVVLSELDESDGAASIDTSIRSETSVIADLKAGGLAVLLHIGIGRIEPGSISLHERTGKLIVRTDRSGWWGILHCCCLRHEFGPGELEPVPRRVYTRRLHRSIAILSGGDHYLKEDLLQRSLSLIRRYPIPDSVDLTFPTAEAEERLRSWANERLTIKVPQDTFRHSSRHIVAAMQGKSPDGSESDNSTTQTEATEATAASNAGGNAAESAEDEEITARLLPGGAVLTPTKKKPAHREHQGSSAPLTRGGKGAAAGGRRRKDRSRTGAEGEQEEGRGDSGGLSAASGADDEGSDVSLGGRGTGGRPTPTKSVSFKRRPGSVGGKTGREVIISENEASTPKTEGSEEAAPPGFGEQPRRRNNSRSRRSM